MEFLLTNALAALLMPPGILVAVLTVAALLTWRRPRLSRWLVLGALAGLYALSIPWVADFLLRSLEPVPRDPGTDKTGQVIVVLAGGGYLAAPEYGGDTVNSYTLVRVRYGAHLYRTLKKPILVTGGSSWGGSSPEARSMREVLQKEFQVPVHWSEEASANTLENARGSFQILNSAKVTRIYLVTHAWHMPRARYAFESAGFSVIPAPTGYTTRQALSALDFIPTAQALLKCSWFFHEVIGIGWYHLRIAVGR